MALESGTYISDLNPSNPVGATDKVSTLDDHVRLIKATLQTTFPGIAGAVTATHTELNFLDGVTGTTGAGKLVLDDAPTIADLTVTDSITLPAASIADAALSDNVPLLSQTTWTLDGALTVTPAGTFILGGSADVTVSLRGGGDGAAFQIDGGTQVALIRAGGVSGANTVASFAAEEIQFDVALFDMNGDADISGSLTVGGAAVFSAAETAIRRADNTGVIRIYPGNSLAGASGNARLNLFSGSHPDTPGAAELISLGTGVLTLQGGGGIALNGNTTLTGAVRAGTAATSTSSTLAAGQIHHRSSNTTVPSMSAGQWVAVQNTGTSSITLSEGSGVTLELGGTTTTGNRTLLAKGFAFIYFRANGVGVVHGNGVV